MIPVDYTFTSEEHALLYSCFASLKTNPYSDYGSFMNELKESVSEKRIPSVLFDIAKYARERNGFSNPFLFLKNCPIDEDKPIFDFKRPVDSKYELKKSFIAEGFLGLHSLLTEMPIVRYGLMNNGDAFHDIYPMEQLSTSLSQKSLVSLGHHQDFPIHFARPKWVNMMAIRNPIQNDVYTTFVRNCDILAGLDSQTIKILSDSDFYTPYDDITKHGDSRNVLNNDGDYKPIKVGNMLMYYEGRTRSRTPEGNAAITALNAAIAKHTTRIKLEDGEFISIDNETTLHGRDVGEIRDLSAHKTRWLIKSHSVPSLSPFVDRFMPGKLGVVNG